MENEVLKVEGMHCASCVRLIESALNDLIGVTGVEVDLAAGTVDVTYDSKLTTLNAVKNVIETEGFFVVA